MAKLTLPQTDEDFIPETYEEWVEIHGEPEYEYDHRIISEENDFALNIKVESFNDGWISPYTKEECFLTINKKKVLNEVYFTNMFAEVYKCLYCNGVFYTPNGIIDEQSIRRLIAQSLTEDLGLKTKIATLTDSILKQLKDLHSVREIKIQPDKIPLANGDLWIKDEQWLFEENFKTHSPYRFSVEYNSYRKNKPLFDKWLNDTFYTEDIDTIQEIFGYCLIPSTIAQEAFILVGGAGVGKSGLGTILSGLMGNAFETVEIQSLVTERFQLPKIEHKLVAYDDDLGSAALKETGMLKKLITADTELPAERKGRDPYTFKSYCKIIACANFMLSSLYDDSDGFYRRLHPIVVREKPKDRKQIKDFYKIILNQEKEAILVWALQGLRRIMKNEYNITWSERSKEYLNNFKRKENHFSDFYEDVFEYIPEEKTSNADVKKMYAKWCRHNGVTMLSERRLETWLANNQEELKIEKISYRDNGIKTRGYKNIRIRPEWKMNIISF